MKDNNDNDVGKGGGTGAPFVNLTIAASSLMETIEHGCGGIKFLEVHEEEDLDDDDEDNDRFAFNICDREGGGEEIGGEERNNDLSVKKIFLGISRSRSIAGGCAQNTLSSS